MKREKEYVAEEKQRWRLWMWGGCELFALCAALVSMKSGTVSDVLVCLLVGLGLTVPLLMEEYGYRMSAVLYGFSMLYMLASLSGRIYKLYYLIAHWDKMLHLCGGIAFALMGTYLPVLINEKYREDRVMRLLFGVLFSISVAAIWEFYEFSMDRWFGMDMQRDTVVTAISSYNLGTGTGVIGRIDPIESVVINGVEMDGYLDIGLIDTMGDMMIETAGAIVYAVAFALDKGRHPAIIRLAPHTAKAEQPAQA